mmetsp:Transcript_579/g.1528  ORF Transcript_579/g.1528 Transcript_579/m.1528 type:complete len:174 (+) Transcript_579:96-617(+)|eukprot:CAMPEP_0115855052 /NCGR_PEP_ID=MMETSP0287-20121206/14344_1 /TAXON_ID=412157 /ORGANISM="Chrysochromulina rotalis, Strain UIO044" /LENGTH=173 /DNA_ID=CAMNT_0003309195 /DNA_START=91 /DNA_END=612 /DNA_ORIENTATION=+
MASTVPRARKRYDSVELKPLSANADDDDDDDEPKGKMDQWLSYILAKLHALLWIVIAGAIAAYTQLFEVILDGHPPHAPKRELNRFFFNIGLAGFGGWLLVAAYLILYVKYILKMPGEWEEYAPRAIPVATVCAVGSLIAFCVAFWPVWGWLTVPAIFCLFLGALNLAHFVPL